MGENPESEAEISTRKKKAILSLCHGRNVRHKGSQVTIIRKPKKLFESKGVNPFRLSFSEPKCAPRRSHSLSGINILLWP